MRALSEAELTRIARRAAFAALIYGGATSAICWTLAYLAWRALA